MKKEEISNDDILKELEGKSLDQQIEILGQEILTNAIVTLQRIKHRKIKKVPPAEAERQEEMQRQFKFIQSTYSSLLKLNKVGAANPNNAEFERELMERLKRKASALGEIVVKVPKNKCQE